MGGRSGGIGEKTTKDVRFVAKVELRDGEVNRLRDQNSVKGGSEGDKKARAGYNVRQTFRAERAEGAGAKIRNTIRKSNPSTPGVSQSSDNKTTKKRGLANLQSLKGVHNSKVGNVTGKVLRSPSASPFEKEGGERGGMNNIMKKHESLFLGFAFRCL